MANLEKELGGSEFKVDIRHLRDILDIKNEKIEKKLLILKELFDMNIIDKMESDQSLIPLNFHLTDFDNFFLSICQSAKLIFPISTNWSFSFYKCVACTNTLSNNNLFASLRILTVFE